MEALLSITLNTHCACTFIKTGAPLLLHGYHAFYNEKWELRFMEIECDLHLVP